MDKQDVRDFAMKMIVVVCLLVGLAVLALTAGCGGHASGQMLEPNGPCLQSFTPEFCESLEGRDGVDGTDGTDGQDGANGLDGRDGADGTNGQDGRDGRDGQNGTNGQDGRDGRDGVSCSVEDTDDGALITCGETIAIILNGLDGPDGRDGLDGLDGVDGTDGVDGQDGTDGQDGQDGRDGRDGRDGKDSIIEVINPCGIEGVLDEVLWRLSSGKLFAVYAKGQEIFLTELVPGNYQTTDGTKCNFKVTNDMEVNW